MKLFFAHVHFGAGYSVTQLVRTFVLNFCAYAICNDNVMQVMMLPSFDPKRYAILCRSFVIINHIVSANERLVGVSEVDIPASDSSEHKIDANEYDTGSSHVLILMSHPTTDKFLRAIDI
jgi:hypothetical protein